MDKKIGNTEDVNIGANQGLVGSDNKISGQVGHHSSVGNTGHVKVTGDNTGDIGAKNEIQGKMGANASVGNTEKITAGSNTGCIGSGNKINIS
ncbi:type VI secretion system spike protein VgrG1b-like isoform X3 [Thunnus thynnus]|eukprot:superscaffoldBa00009077_g23839